MILIEWTPEGDDMIRISTADIPLEHQWFGYVLSMSSLKFACASQLGGYCKPSFSEITLSPEMFENSTWPPNPDADVKLYWTETDEAEATLLFDGTATLDTYDRHGISYRILMPEFDDTTALSTIFADTLVDVMTDLCGDLGLLIDTTYARSPSPDVDYTTEQDGQTIDLMDAMCEFFTHGFYIEDGTLYLYDMLGATTAQQLDELDFAPSSYRRGETLSLVKCNAKSSPGSNPNGEEYDLGTRYSAAGDDNAAACANAVIALEQDIAEVNMPITETLPRPLSYVTMYDESTIKPTTFAGKVISIIYNFDSELAQLEISGAAS